MIGMAFGNDEGRISDANDAFLQLTGYEREDLTADAISWPAMVPMAAQQRHLEALEEILASGRCTPFETEIVRKDGSRVPVLVGAARLSVRRREGVAFVLDITDRKKTVHRLKVELACADALADAATADDAAACVLRIVARDLPFRSVAVWSLSAGEWHPSARIGEPATGSQAIQPLLQSAHATGQGQSLISQELLIFPTGDKTGEPMLVLAGWRNGEPDPELVQTCERIAARLGKSLTKSR
jgi:PAS domain S-box-containing protein